MQHLQVTDSDCAGERIMAFPKHSNVTMHVSNSQSALAGAHCAAFL